jgi:hypothetical protein
MSTDGNTAAPAITRYEIRASLLPEHAEPTESGSYAKIAVTKTNVICDAANAAVALAVFADYYPEIVKYGSRWSFECVKPATTPRPPRRFLLNWEKDRDAEVSDGWLSNIAANGNNLMDDLEWEPRFCSEPRRHFPCPDCTQSLALRYSKFGGFYSCPSCGFKTGGTTRKAAAIEEAATIAAWCGALLVVRYNNNGVPYPGCPACDRDYESPTPNSLYYGRR